MSDLIAAHARYAAAAKAAVAAHTEFMSTLAEFETDLSNLDAERDAARQRVLDGLAGVKAAIEAVEAAR
jgi:predicted RNase H-like nuclease (RuvC/YqgF family)